MDQNLLSLAYLHSLGFTQRALSRIFEKQENYEAFYLELDRKRLEQLKFKDDRIEAILTAKAKLDTVKIKDILEKLQVQIVTIHDTGYPELLRETPVYPYFLYVRGVLPTHTNLISVIGSRKSTTYSRTSLSDILPELVRRGYGIASGGAYGVDTMGHKIAIEHGGYTIAVFGTGIDRCYPKENRDFFNSILASGGALMSAFPIGMGPEPYNFPIRNEIVAGISRGTLVTEAAEKSGTLITAGLALDFGRDVFAIPGEINKPTSAGTNALIRDGHAKLIMNADDILSEYEVIVSKAVTQDQLILPRFDDSVEKAIYELLEGESLDISAIADILELDIPSVACKLSVMEVRSIIEIGMDGSYRVK